MKITIKKTYSKLQFSCLYFSIISIIAACSVKPDVEKEKKAILVIHYQQRQAHMEKNVSLLVGDAEGDFIEINRGKVKRPTKSESTNRFQAYFDSVDFIKWDDISPPIFRFSDDATLATTVVEKLVITRPKNESNRLDTAYYCWLAVYKKDSNGWKLIEMASTNK